MLIEKSLILLVFLIVILILLLIALLKPKHKRGDGVYANYGISLILFTIAINQGLTWWKLMKKVIYNARKTKPKVQQE